jgi:hypothetical protein
MAAADAKSQGEILEYGDLLLPDLHVNGARPEQRVVYSDISWERYLEFDQKLGPDRQGPRLYYLDGKLES